MTTIAILLPPTAASFLEVAGLPLLRRTVLGAQRAGLDPVIVLGGAEPERIRRVLDGDPRTHTVRVESTLPPEARCAARVILIPSDCSVSQAGLRALLDASTGGAALLPVDSNRRDESDYGLVSCSGKEIEQLRIADCGLRLSDGELRSASSVQRLSGAGCIRIKGPEDVLAAEDRLIAEVRAQSADTDGPIARLDRALSTRLSRRLVRTPLRPNHITLIGTTIGLLSAVGFANGTHAGGLLGAFLFWVTVIVDGCDGEVARLKFLESRFGGLFDVVTDNIVHAAVFAGLGLGVYRTGDHASSTLLIALLLGGLVLSLFATYFCLLRHPPVKHLAPRSRRGKIRQTVLRGFEAVMNRDFAYLLFVLAVIGHLDWFFWGAAFGSYAYSAGLVWVYRWRNAE